MTPDGQQLDVRLHEQALTEAGWLVHIGIAMWQADGQGGARPAEYLVWVPAGYVRAIPGTSYAGVPIRRPRRQPVARPATPDRTDGPEEYRMEQLQFIAGTPEADRPVRVHRPGCWTIKDFAARLPVLTRQEAVAALAHPAAGDCSLCGTDYLAGPRAAPPRRT